MSVSKVLYIKTACVQRQEISKFLTNFIISVSCGHIFLFRENSYYMNNFQIGSVQWEAHYFFKEENFMHDSNFDRKEYIFTLYVFIYMNLKSKASYHQTEF